MKETGIFYVPDDPYVDAGTTPDPYTFDGISVTDITAGQ